MVETIKAGRSLYRLPSDKTSRGLEASYASPRCFTGMAEIGARMTGLEWHQH